MSSQPSQVKAQFKGRPSYVVPLKICPKPVNNELITASISGISNAHNDKQSKHDFLEVLEAADFCEVQDSVLDMNLNTDTESCADLCINDLPLAIKQESILLSDFKVFDSEPSKKKIRTDTPNVSVNQNLASQVTKLLITSDSDKSLTPISIEPHDSSDGKNYSMPIKIITSSMPKTTFVTTGAKFTRAPQRIILTPEQLQQLNIVSPSKTFAPSPTKVISQSTIRRSIPITIAPKTVQKSEPVEISPGLVKILTPLSGLNPVQSKNVKLKIESSNSNISSGSPKLVLRPVTQSSSGIAVQKVNANDLIGKTNIVTQALSASSTTKSISVGGQNRSFIRLIVTQLPQGQVTTSDSTVTNVIPLSSQKTIAPKPVMGNLVKPIAPVPSSAPSPVKMDQIPLISSVQSIMGTNSGTQLKQKILFPAPSGVKNSLVTPNNSILMVPYVGHSNQVKPPTPSQSTVKSITLTKLSRTEGNGLRSRKPCNCAKSQCLKLYCECFANGEFCNNCNCKTCFNNLKHERERQKAIKLCLDRNLNAFKPKIGKGCGDSTQRRHTKGCNCKKSGCLKNYCECYEARINCTDQCKCVGCRNCETPESPNSLMQLAQAAEVHGKEIDPVKSKILTPVSQTKYHYHPFALPGNRDFIKYFKKDVIDTACLCLLARARQCKGEDIATMERNILMEFNSLIRKMIDPTL